MVDISAPPMLGLSPAQLGDLALDAAIQADNFINKQSEDLETVQKLLNTIVATLRFSSFGAEASSRIDLAYLPIYESAVEFDGSVTPMTVNDFTRTFVDTMNTFLSANSTSNDNLLYRIRDFCVAVHSQCLSQRMDLISAAQQTSKRVNRAY